MDIIRTLLTNVGETISRYLQIFRLRVLRMLHYWLTYFHTSSAQFQESTLRWFIVSYGIAPALKLFVWLLSMRGSKTDLLVKRCDQSSTNEVENRIIARLKQDSPVQIVERVWDRDLDDGQRPVIVFCVISSRIGTDIENAIRRVHGNSPVVLVLLHCVLSNLLRGDLSDDEELLDITLRKRMTGITHFAFSDREGLYDCKQNTVGFNKLLDAVISLKMNDHRSQHLYQFISPTNI